MNESRKSEKKVMSANKTPGAAQLPSSFGNASQAVTPKDISPENASWADVCERKIASANRQEHDEALLDEAVDETFPASDPVAELPTVHGSHQYAAGNDEGEQSLDHAIEMTFPASDPIAIPSSEELHHEKDLRKIRASQSGAPSR
ncbi:hypothetical protein D3878_22995 [Noviherbaspirillum sedimenti]|uniref:Uncharacterized protein n=2 Tax=Noviherbaspirillum sedimenti TaxID=2320865 RepID=A0A3A3GBC6_9BURK|nr:hypothetical protein D3878_22995 [Noviherbaspirillum sedimenti]